MSWTRRSPASSGLDDNEHLARELAFGELTVRATTDDRERKIKVHASREVRAFRDLGDVSGLVWIAGHEFTFSKPIESRRESCGQASSRSIGKGARAACIVPNELVIFAVGLDEIHVTDGASRNRRSAYSTKTSGCILMRLGMPSISIIDRDRESMSSIPGDVVDPSRMIDSQKAIFLTVNPIDSSSSATIRSVLINLKSDQLRVDRDPARSICRRVFEGRSIVIFGIYRRSCLNTSLMVHCVPPRC